MAGQLLPHIEQGIHVGVQAGAIVSHGAGFCAVAVAGS
jgi:hypothetical protein